MPPAKLKDLSITSVDLVDQGANPDAHIQLFKRKEDELETDPDIGLFQKFIHWLAKGFQDAAAPNGEGDGIAEDRKGTVEEDTRTSFDSITTGGDEPPSTPQLEKEETDTMRIDKSKMTPEEAATLAELEKKYGVADDPVPDSDPAPQDAVAKGAEPTPSPADPAASAAGELHPEVFLVNCKIKLNN